MNKTVCAAIEHLNASRVEGTDTYIYYADETREYYLVDEEQLESLGDRILRGETEAYSRWCAEEGYSEEGYRTEEEAVDAARQR